LGCPVIPTEARNGKPQLNIKCLGGKASDSEHFVMIWLAGWKHEWVKHCTFTSTYKGYMFGCL